ncbi:hypothetical protein AB0B89_24720 [Sphaerisporangium sp. NPDC049002]
MATSDDLFRVADQEAYECALAPFAVASSKTFHDLSWLLARVL